MYYKGPIYSKSFSFSLNVISLYKKAIKQREYVISKQLLRSATSIGANVNEASAAQSRKDFIHKMSISSKEARESLYWLLLLKESELINYDVRNLIKECDELIKILTAIVKTTKRSSLSN